MPPRHIQSHYVREIVKLMLWFMYRLSSEQRIPFSIALTDYVDIYRKTAYFNLDDAEETQRLKPLWAGCVAQLEALFTDCSTRRVPVETVEEEGLTLLWPSLEERIGRGLPLVEYRRHAMFGCFYYQVQPAERVVDLHFVNTLMPEGPFKDQAGRRAELSALVEHCRRAHPEATEIQCGSWLNEFPPFRRLFPREWADSGEAKLYNSFGWWGQFIDRQGDLHARHAGQFRATGRFPYRGAVYRCGLQVLDEYLMDNPTGQAAPESRPTVRERLR